jgi:hypothetical protein
LENYVILFIRIGIILLIVGIALVLFGFIAAFGFDKNNLFILAVLGLPCATFGLMFLLKGNGREIAAFNAQQHMPIAKESAEKMAPTAGKVAKEITKGIKSGLEDE